MDEHVSKELGGGALDALRALHVTLHVDELRARADLPPCVFAGAVRRRRIPSFLDGQEAAQQTSNREVAGQLGRGSVGGHRKDAVGTEVAEGDAPVVSQLE